MHNFAGAARSVPAWRSLPSIPQEAILKRSPLSLQLRFPPTAAAVVVSFKE
jgi:hypothetical protein